MLAGILLYGVIVSAGVRWNWRHHEWLAVALQVVLLLPAVLYGLKGRPNISTGMVGPSSARYATAAVLIAFLLGAAAVCLIVSRGISIPDERAYRFEARLLASGELIAAPPPGAPTRSSEAPLPLQFNHHILWHKGWYAKYPLGWPLLLALPLKGGWHWLANPLLSAGILLCTARIGRALGGPAAGFLAAAMLALSPAFLAPSVTLMSHAAAGLLLATATCAWIEGTRRRRLSWFVLLYFLVSLAFHVRPFTALLAGIVLTVGTVIQLRHDRIFLAGVITIATGFGLLTIASVLLYNRTFTGDPFLSPYALQRGIRVPVEISASLSQVLKNLSVIWRFSAQSTLLFSFPLSFLLVAVGFWANRRRCTPVWLLAFLFVLLVAGHLLQTEASSSTLAERYWFEGYFAAAVLGAQGVLAAAEMLHSSRRALMAAGAAFLAIQLLITAAAISIMLRVSAPSSVVREMAQGFRDCRCVVFLKSSPPYFYGEHSNLNGPDWQHDKVFYAVDPGPEQRPDWARRLGWDHWVVVTYDPATSKALEVR
jgi:hypothetical protein